MASPEHRDAIDSLDLHRPYVDEVTLDCPHCEGVMRRIPEVMDAWFDSGSHACGPVERDFHGRP